MQCRCEDGQFFNSLGQAKVSVVAIAQGASERNISAVVERDDLSLASQAAHDGFTLSDTKAAVAIICTGQVGTAFIKQWILTDITSMIFFGYHRFPLGDHCFFIRHHQFPLGYHWFSSDIIYNFLSMDFNGYHINEFYRISSIPVGWPLIFIRHHQFPFGYHWFSSDIIYNNFINGF